MKGFIQKIEDKAEENTFFRQVLETGENTQVVVMSIPPGGEIGEEVHTDTDQVLYIVEGSGKAILDSEETNFGEEDLFLIRAGTKHNFVNTGDENLKIITTYSPPHHPDGTVHRTKAEADQAS